jgi:hypothetical protein
MRFGKRVLGVLMVLAACKGSGPAEVVTIGVVTGLSGITEPCGCTSTPLGGLDKLAGRIEALSHSEPAFALVTVGDTLVELQDPPAHRFEQERQKANVIAAVLGRLHPVAVVLGPKDLGLHADVVHAALKERGLPEFKLRDTLDNRQRVDRVLHTLGGVKVGLLGIPQAAQGETASYTLAAMSLRAQGAEFVIALVPESARQSLTFVKDLDRIDVVITGGDSDKFSSRVVDDALVVEAGDQGRYLGLLRLHPRGGGRWVYDDEGRSERQSLEARLERLRREVADLPAGAGKDARLAKAQELEKEIAAFTPRRPTSRSVTFSTEPIAKDLVPASWAHEQLAGYNRSLCDILTAATADRQCAPAPEPRARFVGTETCRSCHAAAFPVYEGMAHAHAWATLESAGKQCDVGCIGCHSVGFEQAGGYCRVADAPQHKNVGCESCHGAAGGHVDAPGAKSAWGAQFVPSPRAEVCARCHTPDHSDRFDFAGYLPKILGPGHGRR